MKVSTTCFCEYVISLTLSITQCISICICYNISYVYLDLQCWDKNENVEHPKVREFKGVKKISGGGRNKRRRLSDNNTGGLTSDDRRRLQDDSTFEFMCIQSEVDVRTPESILMRLTEMTYMLTCNLYLQPFPYYSS